jgi:hypothetical protein
MNSARSCPEPVSQGPSVLMKSDTNNALLCNQPWTANHLGSKPAEFRLCLKRADTKSSVCDFPAISFRTVHFFAVSCPREETGPNVVFDMSNAGNRCDLSISAFSLLITDDSESCRPSRSRFKKRLAPAQAAGQQRPHSDSPAWLSQSLARPAGP